MSLYKNFETEYYIEDPKNHIIFVGCKKCGYSKYHINSQELEQVDVEEFKNVEFSKHHYTCLCDLFTLSVVCCYKGYQNMLSALPFISGYSFHALYTAENLFLDSGNRLAVSISRNEHLKFMSEADKLQLEAIKQFDSIRANTRKIKVQYK